MKILNISTSIKGDSSFSIKLANAIIEKIKAANPGSTVHTRDLAKNFFPHLEEAHLAAFFTPVEQHSDENKAAIQHSNEVIAEVTDADVIVIGVPVYNFNITSTMKAWLDHLVRAGITFSYVDGAPKGLVKNKKVYLAIASGAVFSEGPMKAYDFAEPYLRFMLGFIGLTDVTTFRVEGSAMPQLQESALPKALEILNATAF